MKLKALLLGLFVAGLVVSVAVAKPLPGKPSPGNGSLHGKKGLAASSTGDSTGSTQSTTNPSGGKVLICHRTRSAKHPYVLVWVSARSAHARGKHVGDLPAAGGTCPTAPPAAASTSSTTSTTTTTSG